MTKQSHECKGADQLVKAMTDPLDLNELREEYERSRRFDVHAFVKKHGLIVVKERLMKGGGQALVLGVCPFNRDHVESASIIKGVAGTVSFKCFHNSCNDKGWADVLALFEPGYHTKTGRMAW